MKRNGVVDISKFLMSILVILGHYSYIITTEYPNVEITHIYTDLSRFLLGG